MAELTVTSFILPPDGDVSKARPLDDLTKEEKETWLDRVAERLSRAMSDYYSCHIDEYDKI